MTGFGRVHKQFQQYSLTVEMKSVNHRFCEINIRMPRQMMLIEEKLKKLISTYIHRGRVEVFITVEGNALSSKSLHVDWDLLDQYYEVLMASNHFIGQSHTFTLIIMTHVCPLSWKSYSDKL